MKYSPISAETIAESNPVHSDTLAPQAHERARLEENAREPVTSSSNGNPEGTAISGSDQLNQWAAKGKGKKGAPQEQRRGGRRPNPRDDAKPAAEGKQSPYTQSAWPSWWEDWNEQVRPGFAMRNEFFA